MMLRIRFFAQKWSIHIRDHLRPFVELPGIAENIVQVLERGGIVPSQMRSSVTKV